MGIHKTVRRAIMGFGFWTKRPSWNTMGFGSLSFDTAFTSGFPQNHISSQKLLQKSLHHNPRVRSEHTPLPTSREHPPRFRMEITRVKFRQHCSTHRLNVGNLHPSIGGKNKNLNSSRLRYKIIQQSSQWG
ncbi:hypothetical protein Ccrd_016079 [Cynara cardunculus var. scolymus]|uniref:Uncharacterized protein n=1 Tax=Cynara cardunculus var. scolymus TaxID=59895 RepID=A0A103YAM5_CYNCS|nr:hypothetical protein Ccrd_016079 [Cynara cardunculus var. scolymus]